MWTCSKCNRIFEKQDQSHSCQKISLEQHFKNKQPAREIFEYLVAQISSKIGDCRIISLPCCVHLFGKYDFLAALPKKDRLEIRFALDRKLDHPGLVQSVPLSFCSIKNCLDIFSKKDIDGEIIKWLGEAYHLKDKS
jgi:hypothetical protein